MTKEAGSEFKYRVYWNQCYQWIEIFAVWLGGCVCVWAFLHKVVFKINYTRLCGSLLMLFTLELRELTEW